MRLYFKKTLSSFLVLSLIGCTVGPDFVRPDPPASESYVKDNKLEQFGEQKLNQQKVITENWWREFSSPELNDLMERGVKDNHTLGYARKALEQSDELVNAEQGLLWPLLSFDVGGGRQKYGAAFLGSEDTLIPPFTYYEIGPSLTYLVDFFGLTRRSIEKQEALHDVQVAAFDAAYLSVTGNIINKSLSLAVINAQRDALNKIIREDIKNLRLIEEKYKLGASTKNDVILAKNQLNQDEALLPPLEIDFILESQRNDFSVHEAVISSGLVRLLPILLTALAVIIGSAVMVRDPIFGGLAISLIFGSFVSTILSLYLIPLIYLGWWGRMEAKRK